jgi:hypothetical protein
MRTEKSSRWAAMLVATVVAIITSMVVANATQTITTPNAAFISYNLAPGADSAVITPASNKSVQVMGCCTNFFPLSDQSVGQVTLLRIPSGGIGWVGLESWPNSTITQGFSSTAKTHIVYIDQAELVDIQVNSADTIRIHNASTATLTGNVTLIW